jgi:GntR family transcriptional repressor for pyruvate dehydrogenase complex
MSRLEPKQTIMTVGGDDLTARIVDMATHTRADALGRIRLPREREIAESLKVQRATVRERLVALEALGVVDRVQGSGTFLSFPNAKFMHFYFIVALRVGFISIEQTEYAMQLIGREVAATAAIDRTDEDVDALERAADSIHDAKSLDAYIERQFDFHAALARACGNPVIQIIVEGLAGVIREVIAQRARSMAMVSGAFRRNSDAYQAVLRAVRDHEPDEARTAMHECFALWRRESAKVDAVAMLE